jgi:hypothetical protein
MTPDRVKVAEIDELPPGKGKIISVHGREVTVYNREGRYVATVAVRTRAAAPVGETACEMPGHRFDAGIEHSPDRLQIGERCYRVEIETTGIFLVLT